MAQNNLGDCYRNGIGVEKDPEEAVKWYRKAAEQNNHWGQYWLGYCYENGYGVERDKDKAYHWYALASAQGNDDALKAIERLYY